MSYYTRVEIVWDDQAEKKAIDPDKIIERAKVFIDEQGLSGDVLDDLRSALQGACDGFNGMYSDGIESLMEFVSRAFPATLFIVRGTGEELRDLWIREIRNGEIEFSQGPWVD